MEFLNTVGIIAEKIVHIGICCFFGWFAIVLLLQGIKDDINTFRNNKEE